jgi:putative transcriptional regulator
LNTLAEEAARVLAADGYNVTTIDYPEEQKRSIDLIAVGEDRRLVIRATDRIRKQELEDLKKISAATGASPLFVTEEAEEDIAIEKESVIGISTYGLHKMASEGKIFLLKSRGGIFVKIDPHALRENREERGYSRGDLARILGVSRKAVYEYERGNSLVSVEIAEKLVDIFGEEVIGDLSKNLRVDVKESQETDTDLAKGRIVNSLKSVGYRAFELKLTATDIAAVKENRSILITQETIANESYRKVTESNKMASKLRSEMIVVARTTRLVKDLKKEGIEVIMYDEVHRLPELLNEDTRSS